MPDETEAADQPQMTWPTGEEPACDEGLVILRLLAERHPSLFEIASRNNFIDPTHPAVLRNQIWIAFAKHHTVCEKCNEV